MYRDHTVGVVVPAYNEVEHVGTVIEEVPSFVDRVYAVDDCSTAGTWEVICDHATCEPSAETASPAVSVTRAAPVADGGTAATAVVPIRHDENAGAGGALKTGYRHALLDGMDVVVSVDADDQMDLSRMDRLLDPVVEGTAGFAKGNRLADASTREEMPTFRLVGNCILTALTRISSGYWRMRDPQNGYTAISYDALAAIDLDSVPDGWGYLNDLLARLNVAGVAVADVRMPARYGDEESTIDFWQYVRYTSLSLLRMYLWRLRETYLRRGGDSTEAEYG